jgi:hypothetical protein
MSIFSLMEHSKLTSEVWNRSRSSSSIWRHRWFCWCELLSESARVVFVFEHFFSVFWEYFAFFSGKGGGLLGKLTHGIDRARRVLSGAIVSLVGANCGANRLRKYSNRTLRLKHICLFFTRNIDAHFYTCFL